MSQGLRLKLLRVDLTQKVSGQPAAVVIAEAAGEGVTLTAFGDAALRVIAECHQRGVIEQDTLQETVMVMKTQNLAVGELHIRQQPGFLTIAVAQGGGVLVFGGELPGAVIVPCQGIAVAVGDFRQLAVIIVVITFFAAVREDFFADAACGVTLIAGHQGRFIMAVAVFMFFGQVAVRTVVIGGPDIIEAGLLAQQAFRGVAQTITFTFLVLNFADLEVNIVVAVAQGGAVGEVFSGEKVERGGVIILRDLTTFITKPGDLTVGVIAVLAGGAVRQMKTGEAACGIVFIAGQIAFAVRLLAEPAVGVIAEPPYRARGLDIFQQFTRAGPDKLSPGAIGVVDVGDLTLVVIFIAGEPPERVCFLRQSAAGVAAEGPCAILFFTAGGDFVNLPEQPVVVNDTAIRIFNGAEFALRAVIVVSSKAFAINNTVEITFLGIVIERLVTGWSNLFQQAGLVVMLPDAAAAVPVRDGHTAGIVIPLVVFIKLVEIPPLAQAARGFAFAFPLPVEFRTACECTFQDDIVTVIIVTLGLAALCGSDELPDVIVLIFNVVAGRMPAVGNPAFRYK